MRWIDELRLAASKVWRKPAVLFSCKEEWNRPIGQSLRGYAPFCCHFSEVDLNRFDLIVPLTTHDAKLFNQRQRSLHGRRALVPTTEVLELCEDKLCLNERLVELGFGEYLPRLGRSLEFPYLLKHRRGEFGDGTVIIRNAEEEQRHRSGLADDNLFTQQSVPGQEEFATHAVAMDGKIVFSRTCQYSFSQSLVVKGRHCMPERQQTVEHPRQVALFEEMLRAIEYEGICCIDYKLVGETVQLFEINPRFGASLVGFINELLPAYQAALASYPGKKR